MVENAKKDSSQLHIVICTTSLMIYIYINELAELLECYGIIVKLFADDVKVYLQVVNVDDANKLQKALDLLNGQMRGSYSCR